MVNVPEDGRRQCGVCGKWFKTQGYGPHMRSHGGTAGKTSSSGDAGRHAEVVSLLAKGEMPARVAGITGLQVDVVRVIGTHYGYPDLGRLALAAERLRARERDPVGSALDRIRAVVTLATDAGDRAFIGTAVSRMEALGASLERNWESSGAERELKRKRAALRAQIAKLRAELAATRQGRS